MDSRSVAQVFLSLPPHQKLLGLDDFGVLPPVRKMSDVARDQIMSLAGLGTLQETVVVFIAGLAQNDLWFDQPRVLANSRHRAPSVVQVNLKARIGKHFFRPRQIGSETYQTNAGLRAKSKTAFGEPVESNDETTTLVSSTTRIIWPERLGVSWRSDAHR